MTDRTHLRRDIARSQQRRQYLQQREQQNQQRRHNQQRDTERQGGYELPEKQNQTRHNPVSEGWPLDYGFDQQ